MQSPEHNKLKPGRKGTVVTHPRRLEIELACAGRTSLRKVAAEFGVSNSALDRHWHGLSADYRARLEAAAADLARFEAGIRSHVAALHAEAPRAIGQQGPRQGHAHAA